MSETYVEPKGWAGTPGKWEARYITSRVDMGPQVFTKQKEVQLWASQYAYAGGELELKANLAAVAQVKELIKALEPFAELLGQWEALKKFKPGTDFLNESVEVTVTMKQISDASLAIERAMPEIKQNSLPYTPLGYI